MKRSLLLGLVGVASVLAPSGAQAQWSARLALEAPLYAHVSSGGQSSSFGLNESFQPALDVLGSYFVSDSVGIDLELRVGIAATGTGYSRQPSTLGPGVTLDVPGFPLYGRAALPIQLEEGTRLFLRLGGGLKILDQAFIRIYAELTVDLAIAGGEVSFFGSQAVNASIGLWFRL
ncbi:MAG TPA: hypothetical protein VMH40_21940 [Myxococcaceae bacterium]|nr:hypothetical protein [Myxococcaceae bacterium]